MFGKMFVSAEHKTFGARAVEVLATFALWWFSMQVVWHVLKFSGLNFAEIGGDTPVAGFTLNYWLHSHNLTFGQAIASPSVDVVMGTLITMFGAPFLEEVLFRGFFCSVASDENGNLKARGLFTVLVGSFILFGLVHGHWYYSVMLQGVGGLWLARLWFRNGPSQKWSYFSCVAAHCLYNISVLASG